VDRRERDPAHKSTEFVFREAWEERAASGPYWVGISSAARRSTRPVVPFFGAFGTARDDAMVARGSADPLAMLWPEMI
jgi:hypothetical protein